MSFTAIALRNIPRRRLRNSLTVLAIILGVTLVIGVNIAFDSVYAQFGYTINKAVGNVDISIRSTLDVPFNQSVLTTVKEINDVADAYARISSSVKVSEPQGWNSAILVGVNSGSDFDYRDSKSTNITGVISLWPNSSDAVVDEGLNYTIGENIEVKITSKSTFYNFTVVGIYHPDPLEKQQIGPLGGEYMGYTIYIDIIKAQSILGYEGKVDSISIKLKDIKRTDQVLNELDSRLGADYVVNPIKKSLLNAIDKATLGLKNGLQIMSVVALCVAIVIVLNTIYMNVSERTHEIGILRSQGASTRQIFWIFFSESLILGIVGVAIGLFTGIFVTGVFRYLTTRVFQPFLPDFTIEFSVPSTAVRHLILGASAGMVTVVVGGLFPSITACKVDIIQALKPSMRRPGKSRTALKLTALGLPLTVFGAFIFMWFDYFQQFGLGLFMVSMLTPIPMLGVTLLTAGLLRNASPIIERVLILFGKTRKMVSRNIERNLVRSTICFALIGMSLSFVILMGGAQDGTVMGVENVIRSFSSSDLTVISKDLISQSFADNLTNIDDVSIDLATPVLIVPQRTILRNDVLIPTRNSSSTIMAVDPASYFEVMPMTFSEDTPSNAFEALNESGSIILTSPLAKSLNVTVQDAVKMRVLSFTPPFAFPTLTWKNFTVVGIAQGAWLEIMSFGRFPLSEAAYISYNSLNTTFPAQLNYNGKSNLFFVKANSGQDVDQIKDSIMQLYGNEYELSVTTYNDALARVRTSIDEIFYILYSIVMFAMMNAVIGVAAIMIMNIAERRREIGILRSQGMSSSQVVTSIIGEATFLGAVGFFMGTVTGLMFHRITVSYMRFEGFPMPFLIPFEAIELSLVLAVLAAIMSAVYPANRASKLNIVEALRH